MFPNPQDALPLPTHPSLEQYKKRAKDLVKACKSQNTGAIGLWAREWIDALARQCEESERPEGIEGTAAEVAEFASKKLGATSDGVTCRLADAQFVIARSHGFLSWPKFAAHLESLARASSPVSAFEAAADAIVSGDAATLQKLLRDDPDLVRARSTREHRATLLHYVSANGVEGYRQKSPKNIATITEMLLKAGADVDPEADVYGGGCTPLGLVATSTPPLQAGVQRAVIDVLLDHGARMDYPGSTGNESALIRGALMNGCPDAAEHLAQRGAPISFSEAAGIGRLDIVKRSFSQDGVLHAGISEKQVTEGLSLAAWYGRADVITFLLDHGVEVERELSDEGETALHAASFNGQLEVVRLVVSRGADVNRRDRKWKTPPVYWALTGWDMRSTRKDEGYYEVVSVLMSAGATIPAELLERELVTSDPRMRAALIRA